MKGVEIMTGHTKAVNDDVDITYSPDDGGYYLHRYSDDKTSPIFFTEDAALDAYKTGQVIWE
jgi:hypothetical protein